MANLTLSAIFEAIYQLETTDPVLGGPSGIANTQAKQLGNRTEFLKEAIENAGLGEAAVFTGDVATIIKSGFYIIEPTSTNKPTSARGYLICVGATGVAAGVNSFHAHIYLNTSREIYVRSYLNGGPYGAWNKMQTAEETAALTDSFIGSVQSFAMAATPTGWLSCNGALVSRATYADLFAKIGETYGAGNGTTNFRLPDMRGMSPRGWDNGRGIDTGRLIGTDQDDQIKDHRHVTGAAPLEAVTNQSGIGLGTGTPPGGVNTGLVDQTLTPGVGDETRVKNVALHYCIKY